MALIDRAQENLYLAKPKPYESKPIPKENEVKFDDV